MWFKEEKGGNRQDSDRKNLTAICMSEWMWYKVHKCASSSISPHLPPNPSKMLDGDSEPIMLPPTHANLIGTSVVKAPMVRQQHLQQKEHKQELQSFSHLHATM